MVEKSNLFASKKNSLSDRGSDTSGQNELIDNFDSARAAVDEIAKHKHFGLKVHASLWGLSGKVSLIAIGLPSSQLFVFDIVKCPDVVTGTRLGSLLESVEVLKICHSCQNDSGVLFGNYNIQLRNVFDVQCAFKVIQLSNPQMLDAKFNPQYLHLYNVMDFYEFNGTALFHKEESMRHLVTKNPEFWMQRPLNSKLLKFAVASVKPLTSIYDRMKTDWELRFNKVLFQNLVYEEVFRFLTPLIVKQRQNVRQRALRVWKHQVSSECRLMIYEERTSLRDKIWKNDYYVKVKPAGNNKKLGADPKATAAGDAPPNTIQDLSTKFFVSHSKRRYYFDIKEQNGVRFVKISEISPVDQSRNLISINLSLIAKFRDVLGEIASRPMPTYRRDRNSADMLHSVSIVKDTRRYLIDLKRNRWGYFVMISQMLPTGGKLSCVAFSIEDLKTTIQIFRDISEEWVVGDATVNEGSYMRFGNKRYFFNINQNQRGSFMRISEVISPNYQTSMTIAEQSWDDFLFNFSRTIDAFRKSKPANSDGSTQESSSGSNSKSPTSGESPRTRSRHGAAGDGLERLTRQRD